MSDLIMSDLIMSKTIKILSKAFCELNNKSSTNILNIEVGLDNIVTLTINECPNLQNNIVYFLTITMCIPKLVSAYCVKTDDGSKVDITCTIKSKLYDMMVSSRNTLEFKLSQIGPNNTDIFPNVVKCSVLMFEVGGI